MKAVRQTAQNAVKTLAAFYAAHGAEQMAASYGWPQPPVQRRGRFWAYYDRTPDGYPNPPEQLIGWGGMSFDTRDASDDEAFLSVGVFPEYQRRGYRVQIYNHMSAVAKKLGAERASIIVLKTNEAQYKRTMREAHAEGSAWIYAGDNWFPAPGYGYFVRPLA
jgi:GNAT superfamily N-acetyltransferase